MIDSIKLDSIALGIEEDNEKAWDTLNSVTGLNSGFGWNKRTWAREAAVFPAEHPRIYSILVSSFARFNPTWKNPYKVGWEPYECKVCCNGVTYFLQCNINVHSKSILQKRKLLLDTWMPTLSIY